MLTESDERSSMVMTWVVTPEGPGCRVLLETRWQGTGVGGVFERLFAPQVLRRLYADELERLDAIPARPARLSGQPGRRTATGRTRQVATATHVAAVGR